MGEEAISPEVEGSGSVIPDPTSPYADLGEVEPVNHISFAYQIAKCAHWRIQEFEDKLLWAIPCDIIHQ